MIIINNDEVDVYLNNFSVSSRIGSLCISGSNDDDDDDNDDDDDI
jgi:hypothetical protein